MTTDTWEKEFDKRYDFSESATLEYDNLLTIKSFIRETVEKARQEGRDAACDYIEANWLSSEVRAKGVGFLLEAARKAP